jgi:Zinc dependent phospholipase C
VLRIVLAVALLSPAATAYSALTHEAIIDTAWEQNIKPLLVKRFPQTTPHDLVEAHAHAYAGCIIQDMGYYPFGSKLFSDLVHYVRSGDFILNLIQEAHDLNEYAFALGALAHYAADTQGHGVAVNPSVAIEYPKLAKKFGHRVTYADDRPSHLKVEFSFDVLQVARGNYASQSYHDFIGFQASMGVLERATRDTYSLELSELFGDPDLALGTYRHLVSSTIPEMTRVAWRLKSDELKRATPGVARRKFVYNLSRASYRTAWGEQYQKPGIGARFLAFVVVVLPKIGPLKALAFKPPTSQTARLFEDSFDRTLDEYRRLLSDAGTNRLTLANRDFDTGQTTRPAEYSLADGAYAKLAAKLAEKNPETVGSEVRASVLEFYSDIDLPFATKRNPKEWQKTLQAINRLKKQTLAAAR